MAVKTAQAIGRREVHYDRPEDIVVDAERLAAGPVIVVGNWTFAQILGHLARGFHSAIDGSVTAAPWYLRWVAPFLKKSILKKPLPPGFTIPKSAENVLLPPADLTLEEALRELRDALARYCREPGRATHGLFGRITPDEWDQFLCRHAELHMSFVKRA